MFKNFLKFARNVAIGVALVLLAIWFYLAQPTFRSSDKIDLKVNEKRLEEVVKKLSIEFHPRTFRNTENLKKTVAYIENHFREAGGIVEIQDFEVSDTTYQNVRCFFGDTRKPRLVIGAHYDSHGTTPGADDNASGVAGLIELAHLFGKADIPGCIELVAYPLEEPPFFATTKMGSYIHAKSLTEEGVEVRGMIALEMIGYFSEEFGSQDYPSTLFYIIYPNTGNYIAVVGKMNQRTFISDVKAGMKGTVDLKVLSISAPTSIPGIDFSDHRNYWSFGYDAVMVTDTAFYRNTAYHKADDTWDRLNYSKMADVVRAVYNYSISY